MNPQQIETLVTSYIKQSFGGLDKENAKFDFKAKWYDLTLPKDIMEFLKDTTAMVNTFGPDGYIVIGFDDNRKAWTQGAFKDSNLRDTSDVMNLINGTVDRLFTVNTIDMEIDGNKLSVIHIPPSLDKPHVIKRYITFDAVGKEKLAVENRIFVRSNTGTKVASKYDIELMFYDRKNIVPEFELFANFHLGASAINIDPDNKITFTASFTIENTGRRPVAIGLVSFVVDFGEGENKERFELTTERDLIGRNLLIASGAILNTSINFWSINALSIAEQSERNRKQRYYNGERASMRCSRLTVTLANGVKFNAELRMIS